MFHVFLQPRHLTVAAVSSAVSGVLQSVLGHVPRLITCPWLRMREHSLTRMRICSAYTGVAVESR